MDDIITRDKPRLTWKGKPARDAAADQIAATPKVASWISRLNEKVAAEKKAKALHKEAILAIGKALLEAEKELSEDEFKVAVIRSGVGSMSNSYKYRRIAGMVHFQDPEVLPHLPNGLRTLTELASNKWTSEEVKEAVELGLLRPETEFGDLGGIHDQIERIQSGERLIAFFSYYGSKHSFANLYPEPRYDTIIEPFAGSCAYSHLYHNRRIILVEKDPEVAAIWKYLIKADPKEILATRTIERSDDNSYTPSVDELDPGTPQELQRLIGYHLGKGVTGSRLQLSRFAKGWTTQARARVAGQLEKIRHWEIIEGSYEDAPDLEATFFCDPPYQGRAGSHYKCSSKHIDYQTLGDWCRTRKGQTIVCENLGASWLPFRFLASIPSMNGHSEEAIWCSSFDDMPEKEQKLDAVFNVSRIKDQETVQRIHNTLMDMALEKGGRFDFRYST